MRVIPLLTASCVIVLLYVFVFERDDLARLVRGEPVTLAEFTDALQRDDKTLPSSVAPLTIIEEKEKPPTGAPRIVSVVVSRSFAHEIQNYVVLRGETEATRQVDIRAETTGQVVSEPLRKGQFVTTSDELCVLDAGTRAANLAEAQARKSEAEARVPEAQARLDEARSRVTEAEINDNAARKLSQGGFASETRVAASQASLRAAEASVAAAQAGLQSARSGIESAQAAIAGAQKEIERLQMSAPFTGILESDTAELGSLLQPGALCATILQLDPMKLVAFIPETEVQRIAIGALGTGRLVDGAEVTGRVSFISRSSDPKTRTFRVELTISNNDLRLRAGQTVEILVEAEKRSGHLVPQSALTLNNEGRIGLRTVDAQNKVAFYPVDIIKDDPSGVYIAGLPREADIILIGQEFVIHGVEVIPSYREALK